MRKIHKYAIAALAAAITLLFAGLTAAGIMFLGAPKASDDATTTTTITTETTTTTTETTTTRAPETSTTTNPPTTTTLEEAATTTTSTATTATTLSPYAGKGYRVAILDITIPSPHCEQALQSSLRNRQGIVSMSVRRGQKNNTIIYDPKKLSIKDLLEYTAAVGGSQLLVDEGI